MGASTFENRRVTSYLGGLVSKVDLTERIGLAAAFSAATTGPEVSPTFVDENQMYIAFVGNVQYYFNLRGTSRLYPLAGFNWTKILGTDFPSGFGSVLGGGIEFASSEAIKSGFELRYSSGVLTGIHILYSMRW